MAVGGDTKIGSGANFVDGRRGSTGCLEEEEAGAGVNSASTSVEGARLRIPRLRLFAQQECVGMG